MYLATVNTVSEPADSMLTVSSCWECVCPVSECVLHLKPLDGLLAARAEHDAVVQAGDGACAAGQGWERRRGTHPRHGIGHCGEIIPLIDSLAFIVIVLVIGKVWDGARRVQEGDVGHKGWKKWGRKAKDKEEKRGEDRKKKEKEDMWPETTHNKSQRFAAALNKQRGQHQQEATAENNWKDATKRRRPDQSDAATTQHVKQASSAATFKSKKRTKSLACS